MEQYIHEIMEYLRYHPALGILFTFLTALIESLPILGTLFPGSVTMTAIGALIGASILPPVLTVMSAVVGALLGDCLGFWLGWRYRAQIRNIWPFRKFTKWLTYGENFFLKHGGKSLVLGRFVGPTRAAMPLIAGILCMKPSRFLFATAIAALLWSVIYILPGVALGAIALEFPPSQVTTVLLIGSLWIIALWAVFWVIQFFFKQLTRFIRRIIQFLWAWLSRSQPRLARAISNHQDPEDHRQLTIILLFLLSGFLFCFLWFDVTHHDGITMINSPLFYAIQSLRSFGYRVWVLLTLLGTPEMLLVSAAAIAAVLAWQKQWRASVHLVLLALLSAAAIQAIKHLTFSLRPTGFFYVDPSSSFPSGHTLMSVTVFGFLAFLLGKITLNAWRRFVYTVFVFLILLIGFSRLFLGQHWFTDILGGWLLGFCVLLFVIFSYRRMPKPSSEFSMTKKSALAFFLLGIGAPWVCVIFLEFQTTLHNTQPVWPSVTLNYESWWQQPLQETPLYRLDRFGRIAQPFNVQWAGQLSEIHAFLVSRNWQPAERLSRVDTMIKRLSSHQPEDDRPLLAPLYQNRPPALFFIKRLNDSPDILELRLWNSGIRFSDSESPLWVGILTYHTPPEKILRFPRHSVRLPGASTSTQRTLFFGQQTPRLEFQWALIPPEEQPERIRASGWKGDIFILRID